MMTDCVTLGLRVDVDTRDGLREGVPRLLDLFRRYQVRASFFVTFGPDHSGRALRRLWQPGFLAKMWRTKALRLYGLRTLLSGTLLPSRAVGEGEPELLRTIEKEGHELGIHGYDHFHWQNQIEKMTEGEIEAAFRKAKGAYEEVLGVAPASSAAPGWRCTRSVLETQEQMKFLYASDVRGAFPFLPLLSNRSFQTLQLPTTLPTLDELLGREQKINAFLISSLKPWFNVHTVHAEVEGQSYLGLFEEFLKTVLERGVRVARLCDIAKEVLEGKQESIPRMAVEKGTVPGRSGWVACQGGKSEELL